MPLKILIIALLFIPLTVFGEESLENIFSIHADVRANYRWSEDSSVRLKFPFPPEFIPRGQTAVFERTVSPGSSLEVSLASVILDIKPAESVTGRVRINFIDLYNRNPTSTDQTVNVKEAWMMFGRRIEFLDPEQKTSLYALFGKAPKFERQPERNLESYGLVSTAFNRFEDLQLQFGGNVGAHFFWRGQISNGNPVFFRDPNALAGDNGNDNWRFPNPELDLNSGFPILYDAETEELSFQSKVEAGAGAGARFQSESRDRGLEVMVFYYHRKLADRVDLRGTFYGGDLDLLNGPDLPQLRISLPIHGDNKLEYGANISAKLDHLRIFSQTVHQEIAGLKRNGFETEVSYRFSLPLHYSASGKQLFTFVEPAIRVSLLNNDFKADPLFVAPSTAWDWKKYDFGIRIGLIQGLDLTSEFSIHDIEAAVPVHENEFLTTLRFRI